jgi:Fe-S-cluster containining protein
VLVNLEERKRLAKRMRLSLSEFERLCTWSYDEHCRTLKTTPRGCILFDPNTKLCTVYGDHPLQCRTFPFWIGKCATRERWDETKQQCPGAGQGNFVPLDEVKRMVTATTRLYEDDD